MNSRTIIIYSTIPGILIGLGLAWWSLSSVQAVDRVKAHIEAAARSTADAATPLEGVETFVTSLQAIDASETPEDFQILFTEYVSLFERGVKDYRDTGVMGRFDADIEALSKRIRAY